ncbi:MAG: M23 family metallopeptidase [Vicinamibacterales bacterium]
MRRLTVVFALLVIVAAGVWVGAGFMAGPAIEIAKPERWVGAATPVDIVIDSPGGALASLAVAFEQDGTRTPLYEATGGVSAVQAPDSAGAPVTLEPDGRIRVQRQISRESVPGLKAGAARIVVTASRPVVYGIRQVSAEASRDVEVRLERPRISVLSTHHYINQGGTEVVLYRVTPDDVESGVTVGDVEYPGYPASGAAFDDVRIQDPSVRIAFFALLWNQDPAAPIRLYARDPAGNAARADFEHRVFPKTFRRSRIELNDPFLERVVPAILAGTDEVKPEGALIDQYVVINSELRRKNAEKIASFAAQTSPEWLWGGTVFHAFANNAVESAFADSRTYVYQGREVDHQTHLGFDLASYAQTPIVAANRGRIVYAAELGIYGNCVIIDHGMGLQSLYAHLSAIDVQVGDAVEKEQVLGRSGITGLAGGDHLHFTMLVNGQMVNPVEWWDPHWIEDRILRKIRAAR